MLLTYRLILPGVFPGIFPVAYGIWIHLWISPIIGTKARDKENNNGLFVWQKQSLVQTAFGPVCPSHHATQTAWHHLKENTDICMLIILGCVCLMKQMFWN